MYLQISNKRLSVNFHKNDSNDNNSNNNINNYNDNNNNNNDNNNNNVVQIKIKGNKNFFNF